MADNNLIVLLDKLREIDYTSLDYNTLQEELIDYIRTSQNNEGFVDNFLDGDATKVIIDLLSYLGEIQGFRIDTLGNEHYLPTAQRRQSIINILEPLGQAPQNPTAATVTLLAVPQNTSQTNITIPARYSVPATGLDGNTVTFEIMNGPTDYFNNVVIPANVTNVNLTAYSGNYRSFDIVSTGQPQFSFFLPEGPVIEDSIEVSVTQVAPELLTPEIIESTRTIQTDSLVDEADAIIYTVKYDENGFARLTFASELFGKIPPNGHTVHVDYRVGGGANTNVNRGAIDTSGSFSNLAGDIVSVALSNEETEASGGQNQEDLDTVKLTTPAEVRANEQTVTTEDYAAIISRIGGVQDVFVVDRHEDINFYNSKFEVTENSTFIWVLPTTGGQVNADLRQKIAGELEGRRMTATNNFIFNPVYVDWLLNASVEVHSTYDANTVRQEIETALLDTYGAEASNLNNNVYTSQIITTIQNIQGVKFVTLSQPSADLSVEENEVLRLLASNISLTITQ